MSRPFGTLNGVRQGGVLSPLLFSLYLDDLLADLSSAGIGCHYMGMFVGALAYADDLTDLVGIPRIVSEEIWTSLLAGALQCFLDLCIAG